LVEKEGDNTTLKAQPWIAPAELIKGYPGIQWIVGMTIACVKRTEHGLEEQRETKLYEMSGFTGLNYTQMSTFAKFVIALIGRDFDATPNTGNGREFINELFAAIGRLSTVEYLMLHRSLVIGPFSECFEWSEVKSDGTLKKCRTVDASKRVHVLSVKSNFVSAFKDAKVHVAVKEIENNLGYDVGKIFPVFCGPMPVTYKVPIVDSMPRAVEYMNMCRAQRQTDEKGLSAWSGGFAACGNPTKFQLRIQKKLSLILGSLMQFPSGRTLIRDTAYAELEYIHKQILQWIQQRPNIKFGRHVFYVEPQSGMSRKLEGYFTTSSNVNSGDHVLTLNANPMESKKESEWSKVDYESEQQIADVFGPSKDIDNANKVKVQHTSAFHILSEKIFRKEKVGYYVYQLGSIHNMYGYVSTLPSLPLASSSGKSLWDLEIKMIDPLSCSAFYTRVVSNNIARSVFMLNPKFYFNPVLNLLRRLPGKTIDFTSGKLDDDGINVSDDLHFEEGVDEEPDSEDDVDEDSDDDDGGSDDEDPSNTLTTTTTTTTSVLSTSGTDSSVSLGNSNTSLKKKLVKDKKEKKDGPQMATLTADF